MCDPGTFQEIGSTSGVGTLRRGRPSWSASCRPTSSAAWPRSTAGPASSPATTSRCGAARPRRTIPEKRAFAEQIAIELGLPHIRLVDGMGGGGSVKDIETKGPPTCPRSGAGSRWSTTWRWRPRWRSRSARWPASVPPGSPPSHYSVIVAETAQMMIAGPALVDQASLGDVSKEELGHARIHTGNGSIDDMVDTEDEAFDRARGSCPTCRPTSTSCRPGGRARRPRAPGGDAALDRAPRAAPGLQDARILIGPSSTGARSSRSAAAGARRSSPAWPASTAGRWRCSPRTPTSTAARGRPTPPAR